MEFSAEQRRAVDIEKARQDTCVVAGPGSGKTRVLVRFYERLVMEADEIYRLGCFLLAKEKLVSRPLRLLGLGVSGLGECGERQLPLL